MEKLLHKDMSIRHVLFMQLHVVQLTPGILSCLLFLLVRQTALMTIRHILLLRVLAQRGKVSSAVT